MARGFTPIIGLAVVVALALAAVFGSLSLVDPAQAQGTSDLKKVKDASLPDLSLPAGATSPLTSWNTYYAGFSAADEMTVTSSDTDVVQASSDSIDSGRQSGGGTAPFEVTTPVNGDIVTLTVQADADNGQTATITVNAIDKDTNPWTQVAYTFDVTVADLGATGTIPDVYLPTVPSSAQYQVSDLGQYFTAITAANTIESASDPTGVVTIADLSGPFVHGTDATVTAVSAGTTTVTLTATDSDATPAVTATQTFNVTVADLDVTATLPFVEATVSDDDKDIMLSDYFSGIVGASRIEATSDNNRAVSVSPRLTTGTNTPATGSNRVKNDAKLTLDFRGEGDAEITVKITDFSDTPVSITETFDVSVGRAVVTDPAIETPSIQLSSTSPGKNARYTIEFNANNSYVPGVNDLKVQLTDDKFQVPETIATSAVTIQADANVANPSDITVDDQEITLVLGDMDGDTDGVQGIDSGQNVTIVFRSVAGIKNPSEGGKYGKMTADGQTLKWKKDKTTFVDDVMIKTTISLSEDDGGRGDTITLTGKGFKNGTTITFVRMPDDGLTPASWANAQSLCSATVGSDDIGSCEVTVTSPLFQGGDNYVNAFDGHSNMADESAPFVLKPSMSIAPEGGSLGATIQVQLYDFTAGKTVGTVKIANRVLLTKQGEPNMLQVGEKAPAGYSHWTPDGSTGANGELNFKLVIPDNAPQGIQQLFVATSGKDPEDADTSIGIGGPSVTATPQTVVANQRISLVGTGFNAGSDIRMITFAGSEIDSSNINGGTKVDVDNGGNWSTAVDLPLDNSTVSPGSHQILVTDTKGRVGQVDVTVPERTVSISPNTGRVGTFAVVRGENFPSKNDDGQSFSIQIVYQASNGNTTTTALPDASGRFESEIRIPTTATIPSTNVIKVSFNTEENNEVITTLTHDVPEGVITLSETSGSPGSMVTVSGEGFKAYVPVASVMVGSIEVTPSPSPSTDANGMMTFEILIPGLDNGIQTVEVEVGKTTASTGFTVKPSGVNPGDITPSATAVENLGDNFVVAWHFNNDTKTWTFYDGQEGSDLANFTTGESYLIQVSATSEVILNNKTRNLTCVGDNCWNQIVW